MLTGTNHFVSIDKAVKYYKSQLYDIEAIGQKFVSGEIVIGKPELKENQKLALNLKEGRYFIDERII